MSPAQLGVVFALATALLWSISVIQLRVASVHYSPLALNLLKNLVASVCFGLLFLVMLPRPLPSWEWASLKLILSGVAGIALADTFFLAGLKRLGAARTGLLELTYSPMVILVAFLIYRETLTLWQLLGGVLILCSAALLGESKDQGAEAKRERWQGIGSVVLALAVMAFTVAWIKPELSEVGLWWSAALRMVGGTLGLLLAILLVPTWRRHLRQVIATEPLRPLLYAAGGSFTGSFLAYFCWLAGYRYTQMGVAALLTQTSALLIPVFAWALLKEPLGPRMRWAIAIGALGTIALSWPELIASTSAS